MGSVSIRKVVKSYGVVKALHGIDIEIADGEFTVLVGPSGCGKSTLLRMVAGLETVTGGEIAIDGKRINDLEPKDRDIAMVFQNYALYPQMTVAQNMGFALEMQKKPRHVIDAEVARAAEILSLGALLYRKPGQLSGGQRQRVAMGRAIVRHPSVFLFDEPLSNLDAKLRVQMRAEIKALHQRLKSTILYVTHDQIEAMTMADKIVVMNGGRVEQIGTPLELYDRPANIFVAGFMGSPAMNLLPTAIDGDDLIVAGVRLLAPSGIPTGRPLTLGIRPEHVLVGHGSPARVLLSEPTGPELHLTVELGGQNVVLVTRERLAVQPGNEVLIGLDPTHIHVFDSETGLRVRTSSHGIVRT